MRLLSRIGVLCVGSGLLGESGRCHDVGTKKPAGFVTGRAGGKMGVNETAQSSGIPHTLLHFES